MTEKRYYLENYKDFTVVTLRLYDRKIRHWHYDWLTESHKIVDLLNKFANENEQLKQRNENQYNQLTELWEIIEEENWEKLIAMKKQLKEDEERLQKEWVCYE